MEKEITVLVIDDEIKITEVLRSYLEASGYKALCTHGGKQALNVFRVAKPDAVILDLMLPDLSGEDICREIRKTSKVPIIMLTAKSQEDHKIFGLDIGADDYVTKPFSPKELMGRLRAVLRRYEDNSDMMAELFTFDQGYLEIDNSSHQVKVRGEVSNVTPNEFKILITLCKNPNRVFSREDLVLRIFGYDYEGQERAIDTHIKNLRQKIEEDSRHPKYILTVHGVGYKFGGLS